MEVQTSTDKNTAFLWPMQVSDNEKNKFASAYAIYTRNSKIKMQNMFENFRNWDSIEDAYGTSSYRS